MSNTIKGEYLPVDQFPEQSLTKIDNRDKLGEHTT